MGKSKTVIREGDSVRIVNPEFVTSVGYDFTYAKEFERVSQAHAKDVAEFLTKVGITNMDWQTLDIKDLSLTVREEVDPNHPYIRRMLHALAWVSFDRNRPSRGERRITTERREEYLDWSGPVTRKRVVKTGWCSPPSGGQDYFGEYWFEPGGLDNSKTHVILTVNLGYREFDIDSQNVQKIMGDHNAGVRDRPRQGT
jgi:hypothetical protein